MKFVSGLSASALTALLLLAQSPAQQSTPASQTTPPQQQPATQPAQPQDQTAPDAGGPGADNGAIAIPKKKEKEPRRLRRPSRR